MVAVEVFILVVFAFEAGFDDETTALGTGGAPVPGSKVGDESRASLRDRGGRTETRTGVGDV